MESTKIQQLLNAYFEGETTLAEEIQLREFFTSGNVPEPWVHYVPLFESLSLAKNETSSKEIILPTAQTTSSFWKWSIAASFIVLLGVVGFMYFNNNKLSPEEKEAIAAYEEASKTLLLLSENLNKGASKVSFIDEFTENTATIQYLNQFTETKNKYFK